MAKPEGALAGWTAPVLLIGCGTMGGAILQRWLDCGLSPALVIVSDPSGRPAPGGVATMTGLPDAIAPGTVVLLGFKPQNLAGVARDINDRLGQGCVVLSILAGIPLALLRPALPQAGAIVRLMPNLPVRSGDGVVLMHGEAAMTGDDQNRISALLAPLGLVEPLAAEDGFDLATAISGCGPAFVYRFIDALGLAAVRLGMGQDQAARLAMQTVAGAAALAAQADNDPAALADAVASPGGMTRLGLDMLDTDDRLIALLTDTLRAARDRGTELAAAAGQDAGFSA